MRRRCPPHGIQQTFMRRRIVELDGTDPTEVEEVPCALWVPCGFGPGDFTDEFVGLVVETGVEVVAEEAVDEGCLEVFVVAQECGGLRCQEESGGAVSRAKHEWAGTRRTVGLHLLASAARHNARGKSTPWPQGDPYSSDSTSGYAQQSPWQIHTPIPSISTFSTRVKKRLTSSTCLLSINPTITNNRT
jgi:hypothetical protein